jgi:hypothetical protein
MGLADLRRLARQQRISGYACLNRELLTARLLQRLREPSGEVRDLL